MSKISSKKKINTNNNMIEDCVICCESITNKGKRVLVECPACDFKCCRVCMETYLLDQLEPSCMKCKCKWTLVNCQKLLGKSFMNGKHRKHVKNILFDVEKARFPETMPEVEMVVKKEEYARLNVGTSEEIRKLRQKIRECEKIIDNREYFIMYGHERGENHHHQTERKKFMKACPKNDCEGFLSSGWKCGACGIKVCKDCEEIIEDKDEHECDPNTVATCKLLKKETKPCPSCASVIYKISGCDQMWCTQCKVAFSWNTGKKVRGHIHNPHYYEWVKNGGGNVVMPGAALPCGGLPAAFTLRNKLGSLLLPKEYVVNDRGVVSSTKLIRLLQRNTFHTNLMFEKINLQLYGSKWFHHKKIYFPSDCGRRTENFDVSRHLKAYDKGESEIIKDRCQKGRLHYYPDIKEYLNINPSIEYFWDVINSIMNLHQAINHFVHVELDRQRRRVNNNAENTDLRIKFILKRIDEKNMKTTLLKRDRQRDKETTILDIYELYSRVCSDSIRNICEGEITIEKLEKEYEKLQRINVYCNNQLLKYQQTFNLVTPEIDLRSGWTKTRGKINKGSKSEYKIEDMKPISKIKKSDMKNISIFDINFIEAHLRARVNISQFGRRWDCYRHSTREPEFKYKATTGLNRDFGRF